MGDPRGRLVACDDRCGCPSPCPGGLACRCSSAGGGLCDGADEENTEHKRCSCGEHCGCNPCTCTRTQNIASPSSAAAGRAFCNCGGGCTCLTCAS